MTQSLNTQFADMLERAAQRVRNGEHQRIAVELGPCIGENVRHDLVRFEIDFGLRTLDGAKVGP